MRGIALVQVEGVMPGLLGEVTLPDARVVASGLALPGLVVRDVRGDVPFDGKLVDGPRRDGGPAPGRADEAANRAFGVFNAAWQLARGLALVKRLDGRDLPTLTVRIGEHELAPGWGQWSGGHYRLPAARYRLPERDGLAPTGEIHLGRGCCYLEVPGGRLWNAPAYNPAILLHELGHHVTRHTADFRCNARLPSERQCNRKVALDEGTADYIAAVLLGTPDIYSWQRGHLRRRSRRRRNLDVGWTMACYEGGPGADPHRDGQIWAGALWAARAAVTARTGRPERLDVLLVDALARIGRSHTELPVREARRRRLQFGAALEALLAAGAQGVGDLIEAAFATRGITVGFSNGQLRDRCQLPPRLALAA